MITQYTKDAIDLVAVNVSDYETMCEVLPHALTMKQIFEALEPKDQRKLVLRLRDAIKAALLDEARFRTERDGAAKANVWAEELRHKFA